MRQQKKPSLILDLAIVCLLIGVLLLAMTCCGPVVEAQMRALHPRLTPAEAAEILRLGPGLSNIANQRPTSPAPAGPTIVILGSAPGEGPWPWPAPAPALRLDGTPLAQPPAVYGIVPWTFHGGTYGRIPPRTPRPVSK